MPPASVLTGCRILVGPNEISGVASRIAIALAGGGAEVLFFNEQNHPFDPQIEETTRLRRLLWGPVTTASRWLAKGGLSAVGGVVLARAVKTLAFFKACLWAETVVIIGGKGFFTGVLEYRLLRALGKRVVHVFIGTASRPRYLSGYAKSALRDGRLDARELRRLAGRTRRQARRVRGISRHASLVIENPLCGHFHERPFVNFFKLGVPLNVEALIRHPQSADATPPRVEGKVRVLHSPTMPAIKGSARIQSVIGKLVAEGVPLEYRQLTGIPRTQVLHEITQCDFVVDQLYSDSPLAGFAAEASALGKTAIVGGYGWELFRGFLSPEEQPPTAICHPDQLEDFIRQFALDPVRREEIGLQTRAFLRTQWSEAEFATRFARVVAGDIPPDWWVPPEQVRYCHGLGLEESEARQIIGGLVETFGPESLQVDHLPALRERLVAFGKGRSAGY